VLLIGGKGRKHHSLTVLASAAISIRRKSAGADLRFLSAGPRRDFNVEPSSSASRVGRLTPHSRAGRKGWSGPTPSTGIDHEDAPMFAVIRTGGKQYRVAAEDVVKVDKVKGNPGEIVQFGEVLVVGGDSITLGQPTISGASVAAEVLEQGRGPKIIAFKKRRRKNSRRKRGHRQEFTLVRVTEILTDGAKPSQTARPKREPKPVAAAPAEAAEPAKAEAPKPKVQAKARAEGGAAAKKPSKSPAKKADKPKSGAKRKKKG
jgi:large subunit ribosomal protein L21